MSSSHSSSSCSRCARSASVSPGGGCGTAACLAASASFSSKKKPGSAVSDEEESEEADDPVSFRGRRVPRGRLLPEPALPLPPLLLLPLFLSPLRCWWWVVMRRGFDSVRRRQTGQVESPRFKAQPPHVKPTNSKHPHTHVYIRTDLHIPPQPPALGLGRPDPHQHPPRKRVLPNWCERRLR